MNALAKLVIPCGISALLLAGCGARTEPELKAEFDSFVSTRTACAIDADCSLAIAGCPLGCFVAVNRKHLAAVESKAQALIDEYESSGRSCEYDCVDVDGSVCSDMKCVPNLKHSL